MKLPNCHSDIIDLETDKENRQAELRLLLLKKKKSLVILAIITETAF